MTPDLTIEPGPHWWEASALTTAPSLHPELLNRAENHEQSRIGGSITNRCLEWVDKEMKSNSLFLNGHYNGMFKMPFPKRLLRLSLALGITFY